MSAINPLRLYVSQGKDHRVVRHPRHLVSTLTVSFDRRNLNHLFGGQDTLSCVICSFQHVAYYLSWIILLADKCSENSDGSICTVESHLQGEPLKSKIGWFSTDWRGRTMTSICHCPQKRFHLNLLILLTISIPSMLVNGMFMYVYHLKYLSCVAKPAQVRIHLDDGRCSTVPWVAILVLGVQTYDGSTRWKGQEAIPSPQKSIG